MIEEDFKSVVKKLIHIVKQNKIETAEELKKYVYTRNFKEDKYKKMKDVFSKYGELNVFNCVIFYNKNIISDRKELFQKIKGEV